MTQYLTPEQVAAMLGFQGKQPRKFVYRLGIPQIRLSPRRVMYDPVDVETFMRRKRYGRS